jgi:hypothetical protein
MAELSGLLKAIFWSAIALLKALSWPDIALIFLLMYRREIRSILAEVPELTRRLLTLKALGAELSLDSLERELPKAEDSSREVSLPVGLTPERKTPDGSV